MISKQTIFLRQIPNKNIIIESDKSKVICHENDDKGNITDLNPKFYKKKFI